MKIALKKIFEPEKKTYTNSDLGSNVFQMNSVLYQRQDFSIDSSRMKKIKVSLFRELDFKEQSENLLIFLTGQRGTRLSFTNLFGYFLPNKINIACFDYNGNGISENLPISYGLHEKNDVKILLEEFRKRGYKKFFFWGRSMGAFISLFFYESFLHEQKNGDVIGIIADSPFKSLNSVLYSIISDIMIINWFKDTLISKVKQASIKEYQIDIDQVCLFKLFKTWDVKIPICICGSEEDKLIKFEEFSSIEKNISGNKVFLKVKGEHDAQRTTEEIEFLQNFLLECFGQPLIVSYSKKESINLDNLSKLKNFANLQLIMSDFSLKQKFVNVSFLSGLLSGALNKFLTHPIDTIKANIQINQLKYENFKSVKEIGVVNTAIRIFQKEGIYGFYRGVGIACVKQKAYGGSCILFIFWKF